MSQVEIRHLRTLVALRESGSLVEVSERMFLTQSALSHQIKELEGRPGCSLFLRKTPARALHQRGYQAAGAGGRSVATSPHGGAGSGSALRVVKPGASSWPLNATVASNGSYLPLMPIEDE